MPVSPGSFLSLTTLSETLGYSLLLILIISLTDLKYKGRNRKPRRCPNRQHFRKKFPRKYIFRPRNDKGRIFGRCCRRESVFPADITRGDGLNFPFGKTRRIRVNKSSMQTAKPNNVFVLSVISDLRFRLKSPRNST